MTPLHVLEALEKEHGTSILAALLGAAFRRDQLQFRQELIAEGEDSAIVATDRQTFVVDQLDECGRDWLVGFSDYDVFTDSVLDND